MPLYELTDQQLIERLQQTPKSSYQEELLRRYAPLIQKLARRYASANLLAEDLAQEGRLGLLRAAEKYDRSQQVPFSAYAYLKVQSRIRHALRDTSGLIRLPAWIWELQGQVGTMTSRMEKMLGRSPSADELATAMNIGEKRVKVALAVQGCQEVVYLEDVEERWKWLTLEERDFKKEVRLDLLRELQGLPAEQTQILYLYFYRGMSLTEVAQNLAMSSKRTRHLLRTSLQDLRTRLEEGGEDPVERSDGREDSLKDPYPSGGVRGFHRRHERTQGDPYQRIFTAVGGEEM